MLFSEKISSWAQQEPHLDMVPFVFFTIGILTYFNLTNEPSPFLIGFLFLMGIGGLCLVKNQLLKKLFLLPVFFLFGVGICLLHTHLTQTRFLPFPLEKVRVYGQIVSMEQTLLSTHIDINVFGITQTDINGVEQEALALEKLPQKIRLITQDDTIKKGDYISGFVHQLSPPEMPLTPFGFNRARLFFFDGIGATGFMTDIKNLRPYTHLLFHEKLIDKIRKFITEKITHTLSSENKGIAVALLLGDSRLVSTSSKLLYRDLGISHILSVSGFHIGLLVFFVFMLIRYFLNLITHKLSPITIKRVAIIGAAGAGACYLALSGANPPAIRSFIMVSACLTALFFDKRALSIRNLFFAAFLILCFKPVLLMSLGFELSFIAVLCLIGICGDLRKYLYPQSIHAKFFTSLSMLILFNILVSFATAPFVLYTFHQIPLYGVIGNLLLSFFFAFAIIPLLFISICTIFFPPVCTILLTGVDYLLTGVRLIGMPISLWPHATVYVPYFHAYALVLWSVGLVGLALFRTRIKYFFCLFLCCAPLAFCGVQKPLALIGASGKFVGFRQNNTYYETESYSFKQLHQAWLTFNGQNPEKERILPLYPSNSPFIALSPDFCQNAFLYIHTQKFMNNCPRQITPQQITAWQSLLIYKNKDSFHIWRACETDKHRPWHVYCPRFGYFSR